MSICSRGANWDGRPVEMSESRKVWLWSAALALGCSLSLYGLFCLVDYRWHWGAIWERRELIARGWGLTALVSLAALVLSIVMALVLMLGQRSTMVPLRLLARGAVEFVRGTPLLVQLLIGYYVVANALKLERFLPDARTITGVVILALFEAAYLAEIFRGALESIGATQLEAARAVGFDRRQAWRFVILPQAMRRALPGTAGQLVSLVKDSSLLSVISVNELTHLVEGANSAAYTGLEGFIPLMLLYLALTLPLSWWARRLEAKFKYET
jgi:polar amino acid transport system permease protein